MEKLIKEIWIAVFFLPTINATVFRTPDYTVVVYCLVNCYSQPNCINQPFFKKGKKYANNFTLMVKAANFS
jgi:hypothetical protein